MVPRITPPNTQHLWGSKPSERRVRGKVGLAQTALDIHSPESVRVGDGEQNPAHDGFGQVVAETCVGERGATKAHDRAVDPVRNLVLCHNRVALKEKKNQSS